MKDKILDYLEKKTYDLKQLNDESISASYIADELGMSRNLISQYLNEYVNDDLVIKTNTRPVYFYHKKVLESNYHVCLDENIFKSIKELGKALAQQEKNHDFHKLIGCYDSLHHAVEQCKAAISYPSNGLPILIHGPTGTGKSMIAQLMYEYACNHNIIENSTNFLTINCSEYANNPELLTANLFGSKKGAYTGADKDNQGIIQLANNGVLFLDEVHCLREECQEKLFLFMDKGIFHMMGDNENWYESKVRLIFATTKNPEDALLSTMLRRIPVIVNIPSLDDRPLIEKKQLVYHVFQSEAERIQKEIFISNQVFQALMNTTFAGNVGGMKNHIKAACANAFLNNESNENHLDIHIYNLPDYILQQSPIINVKLMDQNDNKMLKISEDEHIPLYDSKLLNMYDQLLMSFQQLQKNEMNYDDFMETSMRFVSSYNDYIMFDKKANNNPSLDFTRKIVDKIFSIVINRYGIKITNNNILSYAKYLYEYTKNGTQIKLWIQTKSNQISELLKYFESRLSREYFIAKELKENINLNLDIELDDMAFFALILNLKSYNKDENFYNNTIAIVLAHGYSTASSIADAANKLLNQYIFDGIDMQLDVSVDKIVEQLNDYLKLRDSYDEIILLVDMGSLEEIHKGIKHVTNSNIGIINNVSTKLALEIGNGIKQGRDIQELLANVAKSNITSHAYINNRERKPAILSVCAAGFGAAEKITELLATSLPYEVPVSILPYNYQSLISNGMEDAVFKKYNVVGIIGTLNPQLDDIPFVAVEEIVLNNNMDMLHSIFHTFLDENGFQVLQANLLKNFTLNNIVNHLTILNANKVLEDVEEVVNYIEEECGIVLTATIKVGLYMHISCLIERLITRTQVGVFEGIAEFEKEHHQFIEIVRKSFSVIEQRYSVEIPTTEIAYIYSYIEIG